MYYVAKDLNTLGTNMGRERMAGDENLRLIAAQIQQAIAQRQQLDQRRDQFNQEMALRKRQQEFAENGYTPQQQWQQNQSQQLLDLQRQQQEFSQNGYNPVQAWEQQFREKELAQRPDLYKLQAGNLNGSALAALLNQTGLNSRDAGLSQEAWEQEKSDSEMKAADFTSRLSRIRSDVERFRKDEPMLRSGKTHENMTLQKESDLMRALDESISTDKRPGKIKISQDGTRFDPVIRPRPQQQSYPFMQQLGPQRAMPQSVQPQSGPGLDQMQIPQQLLNSIQGTGQPQFQSPQTSTSTNGMPSDMGALLQALSGSGISPVQQAVQQPAIDPAQAHQSEVMQLQTAAKSGMIDRRTYMQKRAEIDARYGATRN